MELLLKTLGRDGLLRASYLIGKKIKPDEAKRVTKSELESIIIKAVNPNDLLIRDQYDKALRVLAKKDSMDMTEQECRDELFEFSKQLLDKAISKMSKKKKEKLAQQLENELDDQVLTKLRKGGKKGVVAGGSVLALQGGAIAITGSNLGICLLMTTGLSGISSIIGVTFPFAVYTGAAVLGGKILAVAGFLSNPYIAIPIIGAGVYAAMKKKNNRQYVNLASLNYLIEIERRLG